MEQLLSIGEFAERCGLSRSALRFYDQNGLLRPRLVDDETGYRYYALAQLSEAALVRRLRVAEMPVGVLRRYLAAQDAERRVILEEHLASFRERASAVEGVVDELRAELDVVELGGGAPACWVAPDGFAEALAQVSFAIADPAVRAELGAVWIETREGSLRLVATDSYRLAVRDLVPEQIGAGGLRGVIEADHATSLADELASAHTVVLCQDQDGQISTIIDGHHATVGHRGEEFPDYERILSGVPSGDQIALSREELTRALSDLPPRTPLIGLEFGPAGLELQAADRRVPLCGCWPGPPLRVCVDVRYFADAISATVGPDVVIEASDPLQPITLRSADTGTFSVLTMPVRPPEDE